MLPELDGFAARWKVAKGGLSAGEPFVLCGTRPRHAHRQPGSSWMAEVCYIIYTSSMALSIKSDEADQLARELAAETGETLTEAVVIALRERLDREHARHAASMRRRLARLAADVAALPVADSRAPEEIIGYDDAGLPR
jgi:antitoxin VapB